MFCKHCGNELNNNAIVCMKCGCDPNTGSSFCPNCGANTNEHQIACIKCGCPLNAAATGDRSGQKRKSKKPAKSKVAAGILAILLGQFGVHQFYLGNVGSGIWRIVISVVGFLFVIGPVVTFIFGLIEGIKYLTMSDEDFDETYVQNKRGWF